MKYVGKRKPCKRRNKKSDSYLKLLRKRIELYKSAGYRDANIIASKLQCRQKFVEDIIQ